MKQIMMIVSNVTSFCIQASANTRPAIHLELPIAGIDYPTDSPTDQKNKILVIQNQRIRVPFSSELVKAQAGVEYPTDFPIPESVRNSKVLVVDEDLRVPINIEKALAGIDFPTDGPRALDRDFLIWNFQGSHRVPVSEIVEIEFAVVGIDYPTDGPPSLTRRFLVVVLKNGKRLQAN